MRITILGAGGLLATAIDRVFRDETLTLLTRPDCDLTDPDQVRRVIPKTRPEVLLNLAGLTDVDQAEQAEPLARKINGDAVGTLAAVAKSLDAILLHISTDYVFDGRQPDGYQEEDHPNPLNAYGRTKALGEALLKASGAKSYLVRTAWLFGPQGRNFVDTMLRLGREHSRLKVVDDQRGSPTYTVDLAQALLDLLRRRPAFGIYHRTNDGATTWYDFAREIFRQAQVPVTVEPIASRDFPRPAPRPAVSVLRTTKLPRLRPWAAALRDYLTRPKL